MQAPVFLLVSCRRFTLLHSNPYYAAALDAE
jgi:hypothetical protein